MSATAGTSTGDTNLTSTTNSGNVFTNLSSNAATLAAFPDDRWGYSYSTDDGSTWISGSQGSTTSGYNGLPLDNDDSGATGVILASTDSFTNSGSVKFKIGAKASATQATGTYTNTVNFYAVANPEPQLGPVECEAGKICYNVNSLTATEGTMGKQDATDGNTIMLLASNFSREGYGFAGWSDTYDYSGNLYGPQEDITVPNGTTANGLSLYAIWMPSAGTMQANASSVCSSLTQAPTNGTKTLNSVSALTDQRDNQTYAIAKLADGECWMIENLRLEADATRSDTNRLLSQGYGTSTVYGNFIGLAEAEFIGFSTEYSANSLYSNDGSNNTINIGTSDLPAYRVPRYNNINTANRAENPTSNSFSMDNTTGGMYSYGNYYSWHAAIADTANYENEDHNTTSLCPTNWRIPQGNTLLAGFGKLDVDLGGNGGYQITREDSNRWRSFPNNYVLSGDFTNSKANGRGDYGMFTSSTASSTIGSAAVYNLFLNLDLIGFGVGEQYYGEPIRCTMIGL